VAGGAVALIHARRVSRANSEALLALKVDHEAVVKQAAEESSCMMNSLRESEERLRMTLRYSPDVVFIADPAGRIKYVNDYAIKLLGYTRHDLMRMVVFDLVAESDREAFHNIIGAISADTQRHTDEISFVTKSAASVPLEMTAIKLPNGRIYGSCRDITERKNTEREIFRINHRLSVLIESIPDGIIFKDGDGRWLVINETAKKMFGLQNIAWRGKTDMELGQLQRNMHEQFAISMAEDAQVWRAGKMQVFERQVSLQSGQVHFEVRKVPIYRNDGNRSGLLVTVRDVTEQRRVAAEQQAASVQIHRLAFYDTLTGLPNRRLLMDRLHQACLSSARNGSFGALMFIDLDHFKNLNDSKGHDIGDMLLLETAQRLAKSVRDGDTVARLGGDEFVVVLENLGEGDSDSAIRAESIAEKIRNAMITPFMLRDHVYTTTMSVGIVLFRGHQHSLDELIKHADIAMYQAKSAGRNAIRFYDPVMQAAQEERMRWESELRSAIEKQQFDLHYQVQVDNRYRPVGAEVLLRWQHPERGLVPPGMFIPTAEETGMIVPMGSWVLQGACAQLRAWQNHPQARDLTLAVNVSAKQFHQENFVNEVQRALLRSGAQPSRLKLELTESIVLEDVEDTIDKMRQLKSLGVSCALDDFGTGYSSLQYLKKLPLDQIKIDQTFVRDIASDPNDAAIVRTIVVMAKAMGLHVIAEGVESGAQLSFLRSCGCESFQGYLFNKPTPLSQFESFLNANVAVH
jgi:diguanylate cyclase (GGDEF)-like protein/PAS domain S-box-containing protein